MYLPKRILFVVSSFIFLSTSTFTAIAETPKANSSTVDIPHEKFTLDNGLRVVVHEDRKAPIVAVSIWYHVGSKDEPRGKSGFAHLFEHLMFNGSENYDDEYFGPFEKVGATDMNGTTWFDRTNYFQNVPTPALELALWMESDRMGHLLGAVTQEKLDEQRSVVQNEKRQGDNRPYGKVEYSSLAGLYPEGHPYRHSTIGSMEDLNAASLDDVKQWFKDYYGASNAVLVLAGDIDAQTAKPLVEKYFGDIAAGPPVKQLTAWVPTKEDNVTEVMYDRVPQARIYRQWTVPGRTKQNNAFLNLAANVLGNGKNSRLYKTLVYDKQLATEASASVEQHELASVFGIDVTVKPGQDPEKVAAVIDEVVADFLAKGATKKELKRVTTKINAAAIRGYEKIGGFGGKATALAQSELYAGDAGFFKTYLGWLNSARLRDIHSEANEWLAKGYYQMTVVPFGEYKTTSGGVDRTKGLPDVGAIPALSFPAIERDKLSNGVEVILAQRSSMPLVNVSVQFDAGYAADSGGKLGASSFTVQMLNEGTTNLSALEISEQAELLGATLSQGSSLDASFVSLSALKSNVNESVGLLSDVVRNPMFDSSEVERVRKQWLATIQQEKNSPVSLALRNLPPLLYGKDHAYGIPFTGSGTEESIQSLSRDDLVAFKGQWLRPDNAQIFVVGDTDLATIKPILERHFGSWEANESVPLKQKKITKVKAADKAKIYIIDKKGAPQSLILAGQLAPSSAEQDNLEVSVMNDILGGTFTARVNSNLREDKGWSYGAYTFMRGAKGQRPWLAYAPVQTDKTKESIQELSKEFDAYLGQQPATEDELSKVLSNNINSLAGSYETSASVLRTLMSNAVYGRPDNYAQNLKEKYESITLANVKAQAQDVLTPNVLTWIIVGDREKIEAPLKALGLGDIQFMDVDGKLVE